MSVTLIFKNRNRRAGFAIRRPRDHEEGMPLIILPYDRDTEKEELDYHMEGQLGKEQERIRKKKPLSKVHEEEQGEYQRKVEKGDVGGITLPD